MVFSWQTIAVMIAASIFGLFVGAVPGLTATMAIALLVPVTFFMPPIPAIAAMVERDRDGDLLRRHPRLPAADAGHAGVRRVHRRGVRNDAQGPRRARRWAPGSCSRRSAGLFGTAVLIVAAPVLAEFALKFSSFEYFWLVLLGLTCAIVITSDRPLKGIVSLLLGLLVATRGPRQPGGLPALHVRQHRAHGRHRASSR